MKKLIFSSQEESDRFKKALRTAKSQSNFKSATDNTGEFSESSMI